MPTFRSDPVRRTRTLDSVRPLVVFDGDDTLWFVEPLYDDARDSVRQFVEGIGLDGARWEALERAIDIENVALMGLSRERFPASCIAAYETIAAESHAAAHIADAEKIYRMAASVFERSAPLAPDAGHVVRTLASFCDLALLTKGDAGVQQRRVADAALGDYIGSVYIVDDKNEASFLRVLRDFDRDPADAWSIGNSLASDINPALWLGMAAIWIDAHVWEHERRESSPLYEHVHLAGSLADVIPIIRAATSTDQLLPA